MLKIFCKSNHVEDVKVTPDNCRLEPSSTRRENDRQFTNIAESAVLFVGMLLADIIFKFVRGRR
jgi:hypothetical protein